MHKREVAITGVGCFGPGFDDVASQLELINRGDLPCYPIERFNVERFTSRLAFQRSELRAGPIPAQLIVSFGRRALAEACSTADFPLQHARDCLCVFGTAVASSWDMEAAYGSLGAFDAARTEHRLVNDTFASNAVSFSYPATQIFSGYGTGTPVTVSTGCTAGLDALGYAWTQIRMGRQRALVVAAESPITPMVVGCFEQINALTNETADPLAASVPFTSSRSGFCIGEGAAAIVLEEVDFAIARGAQPIAILRSYASTSSAYHMTAIRNTGEDIARSFELAIEAADLSPNDIELVSLHATSTVQNDVAEYEALRKVFARFEDVPVFTGKAYFGHSLGASNLVETVATVAMLADGYAAPYPHRHSRSIEFDGLRLPAEKVKLSRGVALKNSSGFSGIHSAIVLEAA